MNKHTVSILFLALLIVVGTIVEAQNLFTVTDVLDGDTVTCKGQEVKFRIRLAGIDSPERGSKNIPSQPFAEHSTNYLKKLILNKQVTVKQVGLDNDNIVLGIIFLNGQNINLKMVENGYAEVNIGTKIWTFDSSPYLRAKIRARANRLNIWSQDNYVSPWEWKKKHTSDGWTLKDFGIMAQIIMAIATAIAFLSGGIWGIIKIKERRERHPRIEFNIALDFIGIQGNSWLAEISAFLQNKGLVRHATSEFGLKVRYIEENDPLKWGGEKVNYQVMIPKLIDIPEKYKDKGVRKRSFIPPKYVKGTYVEPGILQRYTYHVKIPRTASFVLINSRFVYPKKRRAATQSRLFAVPKEVPLNGGRAKTSI
jgi:endonuclease YncB( thermonuclease family)